jgi:hypothetical protein
MKMGLFKLYLDFAEIAKVDSYDKKEAGTKFLYSLLIGTFTMIFLLPITLVVLVPAFIF